MKRYHLADVLTLGEVIAGVILLGMVYLRTPTEIAIWVFVIGELCDAFDGPIHRRWPYPDDGKRRWWREYVVQIEHASDIFLSVVCMIYLLAHPVAAIRRCAYILGTTVALYCLVVEFYLQHTEHTSTNPRRRDRIIVFRRWVYLAGVAGGVAMLVWGTGWQFYTKVTLTIAGILIGIALFFYKLDRALKP